MSSLPQLLQTLKAKVRTLVELEYELADLDRQILATAGPSKPTKKKWRVPISHAEQFEFLVPLLRSLRDATEPLSRRDIATRFDVTPKVASRRLARAVQLGYVERVGYAHYRVTDSVRSVPGL